MFVITCAANVASTPIIPSPPPAYDHRKQLVRRSVALVQQTYPQLQDLAESGKRATGSLTFALHIYNLIDITTSFPTISLNYINFMFLQVR